MANIFAAGAMLIAWLALGITVWGGYRSRLDSKPRHILLGIAPRTLDRYRWLLARFVAFCSN